MTVEPFGTTPAGEPVHALTLRGGGLTARFLTWGAVLQDLRLEGHGPSLVLGLADLDAYLSHSRYFGATAGRCANRIGGARAAIDGVERRLDANWLGRHTLHGGSAGCGKQVWRVVEAGADRATLAISLPDGHMGFPGRLEIEADFALEAAALDIRYRATTDRPTLCNLAHHSYWRLDDGVDIRGHTLRIAAEHYLPVDADLIPDGPPAPVAGRFDFRAARPLGDASPLDHNFCLAGARGPVRPVAWLASPRSRLTMIVETTEPGLQVFDGAPLALPVPDCDGRPIGPCAAVALEPQLWPDAPNRPDFPSALLRPGEVYAQHSRFAFVRG